MCLLVRAFFICFWAVLVQHDSRAVRGQAGADTAGRGGAVGGAELLRRRPQGMRQYSVIVS